MSVVGNASYPSPDAPWGLISEPNGVCPIPVVSRLSATRAFSGSGLRVLLVAFHYPPEISGGSPRLLSMEDFLVRAGCRVVVLTPQSADHGYRGGEILHVPLPAYLRPRPAGARDAVRGPGSLVRTFRGLARKWLLVPDLYVPWSLRATRAAVTAHRQQPFDLVVTSSPQESVHAIGRRLKRQFGCRWLADFRDGWTFEPLRAEAHLPLRRGVEIMMERSVLTGADWITAATRPIAADFRERFPTRSGEIHYLPSGFERFRSDGQATAGPVFRMVYTGGFGLAQKSRTPDKFFAALRQVLASDAEIAARFRLVLLGAFSDREKALWSLPPLAGCVEELGRRPYDDAQRLAAGATMLLLVTPPGLWSVATRKLFDYLAVRRPVFALADGNEAARILDETRAGLRVPPDDVDAIAAGLRRAFAWWKEDSLEQHVPCAENERYLTEPHFQRVLDNVVLAGLGSRAPTAMPAQLSG